MPIPTTRGLVIAALERAIRLSKSTTAAIGRLEMLFKTTRGWRLVLPPKDGGLHLLAVCMINENIGFAAGRGGCIIKTIDSGQTWAVLAQTQTTEDLYAIHFADTSTGYAVGTNGTILRTENGGANWTTQSCPLGREFICMGVYVLNGQKALLVGGTYDVRGGYETFYHPGFVFLTNDGGETWSTPQSTPAIVPFLHDISMGTPTTGVAVGHCWAGYSSHWRHTSIIMRTTDGGQSWIEAAGPSSSWLKVTVHGENAGILLPVCCHPYYLAERVPIGGGSWYQANVDRIVHGGADVCFADASTAILSGSMFRALIMKSTDAGATWHTVDNRTYPSVNGISFGSPSAGIAVGAFSTVVRSLDGGDTWQRCDQFLPWAVGNDEDLLAVHFQGETGYAVGWRGTIIRTTDSGGTWQRINSVLPGLHRVYFKDPMHGFFGINAQFGRRGLFRTIDGGVTLEEFRTANNGDNYEIQEGFDTSPAGHIAAISFGDDQVGVFFGQTGCYEEMATIYRTTDGGSSWQRVEPPWSIVSFLTILDVQFISPTVIIAVCRSPATRVTFLRSLDAGVTWERVDLWDDQLRQIKAIHFPPGQDQIGFAVGESGCFIKTTDGGASWTRVDIRYGFSSRCFSHFKSLHFIDHLTGWIVGNGVAEDKTTLIGEILRTNDGGETWQYQGMPGANPDPLYGHGLEDVFFLNRDVGIVVGRRGFVARTTTGGQF